MSNYFGLKDVANFWEGVVKLNNWHQHRISKLIVKKLFGTVTGKKIYVLGFAFKANTNDTRESSAITICKDLLEEGAILLIHDQKVKPFQIANDLGIEENQKINLLNEDNNFSFEGQWCFSGEIENGFSRADAVVVLTEWDEYSKINWQEMSKKMRTPAWIFDARSIIDPNEVKKANLNFWRIGDGSKN